MQKSVHFKADSLESLPMDKVYPSEEEKTVLSTYFADSKGDTQSKNPISNMRFFISAVIAFILSQLSEVSEFIKLKLGDKSGYTLFAVKIGVFICVYVATVYISGFIIS
jgi:hypothetical protein